MAGNAYEPTQPALPEDGVVVLRGGGWYYSLANALIASRQEVTSKNRDVTMGLRVCASFPLP
ncbi:hypothetical protein [Hyalangium versicolor]|uniref:hypothetical protein n=1 Tax=Hyalangium versicolor TaxID=2861190 RepID=UPI0035A083EF